MEDSDDNNATYDNFCNQQKLINLTRYISSL